MAEGIRQLIDLEDPVGQSWKVTELRTASSSAKSGYMGVLGLSTKVGLM